MDLYPGPTATCHVNAAPPAFFGDTFLVCYGKLPFGLSTYGPLVPGIEHGTLGESLTLPLRMPAPATSVID